MDIYGAAIYFDQLAVTDAYSGAALFNAQLDLYDASERDSMTGWRRSCSAAAVTMSARRAVAIGGQVYLAGNRTPDFLGGVKIREHLLLHPADGLYSRGWAKAFLEDDEDNLTDAYGALAIRKEVKEEGQSSQTFNLYNVYVATTETVYRDQLLLDANGVYFRVQNVERQTGGFKTLYVSELEAAPIFEVTYTPAGAYDAATDTVTAGTQDAVQALYERYQTNYRYTRWAAEKFRNGDVVLTVNATDIAAPEPNDRFSVAGEGFRVLERQSDGHGCWELHLRPAAFNLVVET
jgi:hypothetical protein